VKKKKNKNIDIKTADLYYDNISHFMVNNGFQGINCKMSSAAKLLLYVNFVPFPTFRAKQDVTPLYLPNLLQKDQNSSIFNGDGLLIINTNWE